MVVENAISELTAKATKIAEEKTVERFGEGLALAQRLDEVLPRYIKVSMSQKVRATILACLDANNKMTVVSSHIGHFDGLVLADVCKEFVALSQSGGRESEFKGLQLTIAKSILTGAQNPSTPALYEKIKPYLLERELKPVPYTRKKDIEVYHMPKPGLEELLNLERGMKAGYGLSMFAGGSVEAGRKSGHSIKGMQEVTTSDILDLFLLSSRKGKYEPFIVPVGISNTHRIFDPDKTKLTAEALILLHFGIFLGFFRAKVGMPITLDRLQRELPGWQDDPLGINRLVMREVGLLVPRRVAGVYHKSRL